MPEERKKLEEKVENPWKELERTEAAVSKSDADLAPKPDRKLPEGSYGELNRTDEEGNDLKGE